MGFEDKTIQCVECSQNFVFTASEQETFATRGYTNVPKRCPSCREARRGTRGPGGSGGSGGSAGFSGGYRAQREMYPAVCASCGKETQVPFQPTQGRPVYCSDCYAKTRPATARRY